MNRKSASTLIYFHDRAKKKVLKKRPKHVNKEKRSKYTRATVAIIGACVLIAAGIWSYIKYRPFDITSVEIEGAQRFVNAQDVKKIAEEISLDKNMIFTDLKNLEKIISGNFLAARSVEVKRGSLRSLSIKITERVPIALILTESSREVSGDLTYYFVDSEGFILGTADKSATNLPVINYGQNVEIGKFVEPGTVSYYFDLIKALDADGVYASTISSHPRYTRFSTTDNTEVVFTNSQSAKSQVKIYNKMMEAFKAEGKAVRKIDLRYDKVIVEFNGEQ